MTNRRDGSKAAYGRTGPRGSSRLPPAFPALADPPERLLAAYLDRPLLPETFSGTESLDPASGRSLDDWQTFHEAGLRLVEYLHYTGGVG